MHSRFNVTLWLAVVPIVRARSHFSIQGQRVRRLSGVMVGADFCESPGKAQEEERGEHITYPGFKTWVKRYLAIQRLIAAKEPKPLQAPWFDLPDAVSRDLHE
ncbi:hypothetical protein B9Z19DRAFT_1118487 [Tuber borchii]|uniref:Secreted protein n=1 Tax=Tuber borchii TaxID=42251 RepID=A0A2T7A8B1_TUBBO|nr:hypothetical protein B9Z19DRAFT_1118487 [Tuber borchii]